MSLLDFNDAAPKSGGSKKSLKYLFGIGARVGTITLGSTLAASINLNDSTPIEFGQGVAQTTACDNEITITPFSTFINANGAGSHKFTSLKISGINSSEGSCSGKSFLIKAYSDTGLLDLFNYTDSANSINQDYDFVEIANNNGEFTWISGGTDGDDVTQGASGDITETSFTLSFTSNVNPITRTPLTSAEDVKRITVETYDTNLLSDRVLTSSQVGFLSMDFNLDQGFDATDALPGGNFDGVCDIPTCAPYFTIRDWILNMSDEDVYNFNDILGTTGLTRSQLNSGFTAKFTYNASADLDSKWNLKVEFLGENFFGFIGAPVESLPGAIFGFNGQTGVFVAASEGVGGSSVYIILSLSGALQGNSPAGTLIPYGDQPDRSMPIRNLYQIWNESDASYEE